MQLTTIMSGFIIPRIILVLFGSEVNGLISSINQFLNYIQLVEGGLGGVVMAALYRPLRDHNEEQISEIVAAADSFFKQIGFILVLYTAILSFTYPKFVNTGFSYLYSIGLIVVLASNLIVQYLFSITYKLLLNADRKVYIVANTQSVILLLNLLFVIIGSLIWKDILVIKLISAVAFFAQPLVFSFYVKKHYVLNKKNSLNKGALNQRWAAFGTNLAFFVHNNTDIVILTFLSTLANVSVYSVYLMIINALKGLVSSVSSAIVPSFGKSLASNDINELNETFDKYELVVQLISFLLFSCGAILIVPFVLVYTAGINDANYYQPGFAIILILAEFVYCIRDPYVQATSAAGMFKIIAPYSYVEALLNVAISIVLVKKYALLGVAIGTIIAMLFRMIAQIIIVNKRILHRSSISSFIRILLITLVLLISYYSFVHLGPNSIAGYGMWFVYACVVFAVNLIITFIIRLLLYPKKIHIISK